MVFVGMSVRKLLPWAAGTAFGFGLGLGSASLPFATKLHSAGAPNEPLPSTAIEGVHPSLLKESRASQIMRFGFPSYENLKTFEDFVLSYDRRNRVPYWVAEHLSPDRMVYDASVDRSKCDFKSDPSVHKYFRSRNKDYKASGFDRGHMAAAGNHRRTQNSIDQTFLLTNMAPQVGVGFNRGKWNELEKRARGFARRYPNVYVCTGPLYLPQSDPKADGQLFVRYRVIGHTHVAVPTHFFKTILVESKPNKFTLESYVLPNEPIDEKTPLDRFMVPLDSIERAAGFLLFDKLDRKQLLFVNGKKPW